jgi:hypothetical protein
VEEKKTHDGESCQKSPAHYAINAFALTVPGCFAPHADFQFQHANDALTEKILPLIHMTVRQHRLQEQKPSRLMVSNSLIINRIINHLFLCIL